MLGMEFSDNLIQSPCSPVSSFLLLNVKVATLAPATVLAPAHQSWRAFLVIIKINYVQCPDQAGDDNSNTALVKTSVCPPAPL